MNQQNLTPDIIREGAKIISAMLIDMKAILTIAVIVKENGKMGAIISPTLTRKDFDFIIELLQDEKEKMLKCIDQSNNLTQQFFSQDENTKN